MRVDINAPICIYPAPPSNNRPAVGKAMKPGIRVIAPTTAAMITPNQPEEGPMSLEMSSGLIIASNKPTNKITSKDSGSIFSKAFQAFKFFLSYL